MIRNTLNGKQKACLRSQGMTIDPVVNIGKEGITPTVVGAAAEAIARRELIKVRVLQNCPEEPEDAIEMLAERVDCDLVQKIGRNALLFRRNPKLKEPAVELP